MPCGRIKGDSVDLAQLRAELGPSVAPVPWLPGFFALDAAVKLAGPDLPCCAAPSRTADKPLYLSGLVYGVDVSSGAAVAALGVQAGDHVLDLCCAPGGKLAMLADAVHSGGDARCASLSQWTQAGAA